MLARSLFPRSFPSLALLLIGLAAYVPAQAQSSAYWETATIGGDVSPEATFTDLDEIGSYQIAGGAYLGHPTAGGSDDRIALAFRSTPTQSRQPGSTLDRWATTAAFVTSTAPFGSAPGTAAPSAGPIVRVDLDPASPFIMIAVYEEAGVNVADAVVRATRGGPVTTTRIENTGAESVQYRLSYVTGTVRLNSSSLTAQPLTLPFDYGTEDVLIGLATVGADARFDTSSLSPVGRRTITSRPGFDTQLSPISEDGAIVAEGSVVAMDAPLSAPYGQAGVARITRSITPAELASGLVWAARLGAVEPKEANSQTALVYENLASTVKTKWRLERATGEASLQLRQLAAYGTTSYSTRSVTDLPGDPNSRWRFRSVAGDQRIVVEEETGEIWIPRISFGASYSGNLQLIGLETRGGEAVFTDVEFDLGVTVRPPGWRPVVIAPSQGAYPFSLRAQSFAIGDDAGSWRVVGAGDIWGDSDAFSAAWREAPEGQPAVRLRGRIQEVGAEYEWAKGGLMIRASYDDGAPYVFVHRRPTGEYYVQWRLTADAEASSFPLPLIGTPRITLASADGTVTISTDGTTLWSDSIELGEEPAALLASTASNFDTRELFATTLYTEVDVAFSESGEPTSGPCTELPSAWQATSVGFVAGEPGRGAACLAGGDTPETYLLQLDGGGDIWGDYDRFEYVHRETNGANFTLDATVRMDGSDGDLWAKTGLMARESLAPDAPYIYVFTPNQETAGVYVHIRREVGGDPEFFWLADKGGPNAELAIERSGEMVTIRATDPSNPGGDEAMYTTSLDLGPSALVGIATTATDPSLTGALKTSFASSITFSVDNTGPLGGFQSEFVTTDGTDALFSGTVLPSGRAPFALDVTAAGDLWGATDQFQYIYQTLRGDGELTIRTMAPTGVDGYEERWAKGGAMLRAPLRLENGRLDPSAPYAMALTTSAAGIHTHARKTQAGETTRPATFAFQTPELSHSLRLRRTGDVVQAYVNTSQTQRWVPYGDPMTLTGDSLYAGFALTSTQADFSQPGSVQALADIRVGPLSHTATAWTTDFDGPERMATSSTDARWWTDRRQLDAGARFDLSGTGTLAIASTGGMGRWRSEPIAADGGLDVELALRSTGTASPTDRLRVLALVDGEPRELATLIGSFDEETVTATGLDGTTVELVIEATANGASYAVESVTATPSAAVSIDATPASPTEPLAALQFDPLAPNPTRGHVALTMVAAETGRATIEVCDLLGRRQLADEVAVVGGIRVRVPLALDGLAAGVYVVRVAVETGQALTQRLTVVR